MYKIKMLCFDSKLGVEPYEDEPECANEFETKNDAIEFAIGLAEQECDYLNDGADEGISFGVVVDDDGSAVRVNYYYNEENDTTRNTEQVTIYYVTEI